jgi:hypothetical protein
MNNPMTYLALSFGLYSVRLALGALRAFETANFFRDDTLVLYKFVTIVSLSIRK